MAISSDDPPTLELRRGDGTQVRLRYLPWRGGVLLVARAPLPRWAEEARTAQRVVVRFSHRDEWLSAPAHELLDPEERGASRNAFVARFGEAFWERHFSPDPCVFAVRPDSRRPAPPSSAERIGEEFDAVAPLYADQIARQPFQAQLRVEAMHVLRRTFPDPGRLIEFGPGTGAQTLPMLRAGHRVLAIDHSGRMLDELVRLAKAEDLDTGLACRRTNAGDVDRALQGLDSGGYDGAYSLFGALSLEEHLDRLSRPLADALRPGARFVAGILNRWALFASLEFGLAGRYRHAIDRLRGSYAHEGWVHRLTVRPMTGREFARYFSEYFDVESFDALSVITPPFPSLRLEAFWGTEGMARLGHLDRALARSRVLAATADHLLVTLRRKA